MQQLLYYGRHVIEVCENTKSIERTVATLRNNYTLQRYIINNKKTLFSTKYETLISIERVCFISAM